jgi:hypothetical protein
VDKVNSKKGISREGDALTQGYTTTPLMTLQRLSASPIDHFLAFSVETVFAGNLSGISES